MHRTTLSIVQIVPLILLVFITNALAQGSAISITKTISGSWYNSSEDGHGFLLEVVSGNVLVAYWFVYDPDGNQAWFVGRGSIQGSTATVPVVKTDGARFGSEFDAQSVVKEDWGTVTFSFDSCNSGMVSYNLLWGSGTLPITRLTALEGLECTSPGGAAFAGRYTGTYWGDDSGTFDVTADSNGNVFGSAFSDFAQAGFLLEGTVDSTGALHLVSGTASIGAEFTGTVSGNGTVSGTWRSPPVGFSGSFAGSRQ